VLSRPQTEGNGSTGYDNPKHTYRYLCMQNPSGVNSNENCESKFICLWIFESLDSKARHIHSPLVGLWHFIKIDRLTVFNRLSISMPIVDFIIGNATSSTTGADDRLSLSNTWTQSGASSPWVLVGAPQSNRSTPFDSMLEWGRLGSTPPSSRL